MKNDESQFYLAVARADEIDECTDTVLGGILAPPAAAEEVTILITHSI